VDAGEIAQQHDRAAGAQREIGEPERGADEADIGCELLAVEFSQCGGQGTASGDLRGEIRQDRRRVLAADQLLLEGMGELLPVRDFDDERKTVGERGVEGFGAGIDCGVIPGGGRIHRRPAMLQIGEWEPLNAALMDDGEELVLDLGAAAGDFVEENSLRAPDGGGGLNVIQRPGGVRKRVADQIVKAEQAGVVVAVG
jgi:hypothetical protein